MDSSTMVRQAYELGRIRFEVVNGHPDLEPCLEQLLPRTTLQPDDEKHVYDAGTNGHLRELINYVLKLHAECLWIDAACIVSPKGHRLLISGQSGAGKSTTSLAISLGYDWKVLGEDIILIDPNTDEILNFASPFSLKAKTAELVEEAVNVLPSPILLEEWVPLGSRALGHSCPTPFDLVVHLERDTTELECNKLSTSEYARKIFTLSNLIRRNDVSDKFFSYLPENGCYRISGGTVRERIEKIFSLCGYEPNQS